LTLNRCLLNRKKREETLMRTKLASISNLLIILSFLSISTSTFATPKIQHWQAPSGAQVYFVEDHDLPMLDVAVNFPAGSAFDEPSKLGVALLANGLLDAGVNGFSEDEIGRKLADIGARKSNQIDADRSNVSIRTLSNPAQRTIALDIFARMLQHPLYPEGIIAREKARLIASLKEAETKPEALANKAFGKAVFGNHPYGWTMEVAHIEKIQRADIESYYLRHYAANTAVVAIMGDLTRTEAEAIAQQLTVNLPAGGSTTQIPPVLALKTATEQRLEHPATQSHILIGAPGITRNDADYFPLYVGNYILGGGGFVSRLMTEIREKRGLAYSVYSYFMPMQQAGAFQIGLQTKKDQANEALSLTRTTLKNFVQQGVTEQELQAAKNNLIGGFSLRIDSNRKILDYLSIIGFYKLPLTYLDDFTLRVNQVTRAQINEAFKRRLRPENMATVLIAAPASAP
jgi:zinc protease